MAEETRERSTTSAGLWPEATASDLNNDSCWLYLMKGLGSDRDKRLSLGVLRAFLQTITGEFKVVGQNGTTTITNLLMKIVGANNVDVVVEPESITFVNHPTPSSTQNLLKLTKNSLTIPTSEGIVTIASGKVTIAKESNTVVVNKYGVTVSDTIKTAKLDCDHATFTSGDKSVAVNNSGVSFTKNGVVTAAFTDVGTRITYDTPSAYSASAFPVLGTTIKQSLSSSTVIRIDDASSSVQSKKLKLDWTPSTNTEVVVDFQSAEAVPLKVLNANDDVTTSEGFVKQAPNTVRRYVYKGSTTGWVVLY